MPEQRTWRPLSVTANPSHGLPVLLAAMSTGLTSYSLRVTDMANMWAEDLDRPAISKRGWDEETSIDPSETPENMARFLSSLRSALDGSQPGHDQTSLTLSPGSSVKTGEDGFIVKVRCTLPGILPLVWPFHLRKAPPSALATDLVLPLMEGGYDRKLEVDSLIQSLGHKDAVIAKLVDKLEAMGTGLENVFTGLSGRRKVTRALAGEKIRGLAPFEASRWRASQDQHGKRPTDMTSLLQGMSDTDGLRTESFMEVEASPDLDRWWHSLDGGSSLPMLGRRQEAASPKPRDRSSLIQGSGNGSDAYEDRPAPSQVHSGARGQTSQASRPMQDDDSTASEDDDAATTVTLSQRSGGLNAASAARSVSVGRIGGPRPAQAPGSSASISQRSRDPVVEDDADTASETEIGSVRDDGDAAIPLTTSSTPRAGGGDDDGVRRKAGLGRIGGVRAMPQPQQSGADGGEGNSGNGAPQRRLGGIGRIGGVTRTTGPEGAASPASRPAVDVVERGRHPIKRETETQASHEKPQDRETSKERAARRREELKREMEKASAGPAKKKRRF